jgi:hypothetical protein
MIRLMEVLLNGGANLGGWTAKQIHTAALTSFQSWLQSPFSHETARDARSKGLETAGGCSAFRSRCKM